MNNLDSRMSKAQICESVYRGVLNQLTANIENQENRNPQTNARPGLLST